MYTDIKTFEDACLKLGIDAAHVVPDFFEPFPKEHKEAMQAHVKLIIINQAINEGWKPDWDNGEWDKYYPWFDMRSSASGGFLYDGCGRWRTDSAVGSRLCFETSEKAKYAGTQFKDLYEAYFVIKQ